MDSQKRPACNSSVSSTPSSFAVHQSLPISPLMKEWKKNRVPHAQAVPNYSRVAAAPQAVPCLGAAQQAAPSGQVGPGQRLRQAALPAAPAIGGSLAAAGTTAARRAAGHGGGAAGAQGLGVGCNVGLEGGVALWVCRVVWEGWCNGSESGLRHRRLPECVASGRRGSTLQPPAHRADVAAVVDARAGLAIPGPVGGRERARSRCQLGLPATRAQRRPRLFRREARSGPPAPGLARTPAAAGPSPAAPPAAAHQKSQPRSAPPAASEASSSALTMANQGSRTAAMLDSAAFLPNSSSTCGSKRAGRGCVRGTRRAWRRAWRRLQAECAESGWR